MDDPEFSLKHLPQVIDSGHDTERTALGLSRGSSRTDQTQSARISQTRIENWARACGRHVEKEAFAQSLDGAQVESQLGNIFRETPEFGRSIALRLADFHDSGSKGNLTFIEAIVFFDPEKQRVLKLLSPAGKAHFGWVIDRHPDEPLGKLILRPSQLVEALQRYHLAEQAFPTGLEIEALGSFDHQGTESSFLLFSQPFFLGTNPTESQLHNWMHSQGWQKITPLTELKTLAHLTWQKANILATDVRPENVILAESDHQLYPFDFIISPA